MKQKQRQFIAEAMKVLGYVNRFSRGVYRVQKELEENGNGKASFDFSLITAFRVVEPISTTYFEEGFGEEESDNKSGESTNKLGESTDKTPIKSEELPKKTPNKSEELPKKAPNKLGELPKKTPNKSEGLPKKTPNKSTDKKEESTNKSTNKKEESTNKSTNKIEEEILKVIIDNPFYNRKELSEIFGRTEEGIGYYLKKLTKAGIIKREGAKKNGKWVVIDREELDGQNN